MYSFRSGNTVTRRKAKPKGKTMGVFENLKNGFFDLLNSADADYVYVEFVMPNDPDPETRGAIQALNDAHSIPHDAVLLMCKRLGTSAKFFREDKPEEIFFVAQNGEETQVAG
jgi:hypothetical protein